MFLIFLLSLTTLLSLVLAQSTQYFMVEKLYMCEEYPEQIVKFYLTPLNFNAGHQTVNMNLSSPKPIGENANIKAKGFLKIKTKWHQIFFMEEDFCKTFRGFVGPVFYDIERSAGILPGSCPIPMGHYHVVNYTFHYETLKVHALPFGDIKVRFESYNKQTKVVNSCFVVFIKNNA